MNDGACNAPREEENVLYVFIHVHVLAFKKQVTREDGTGVAKEN